MARVAAWGPGRVSLAAGTVAALVLAVALTVLRGVQYLAAIPRANGNLYDFGIFYRSAVAFWHGTAVYPPGQPNFSPPVAVVLLSPVAAAPATIAYRVFVAVSVAVLVGALAWTARAVHARPAVVVGGIVALLATPALAATLGQGQVYALLAAGLATAWVLDRAGHEPGAGIALGVVVACKPVLAPVLLWPLLRGRRRELRASLITVVAATVAGVALVGPAQTLRYVRVALGGYPAHDLDNASLLTTGIRLVTPGREVVPLVDAPWLGWVVGAVVVALLAVTVVRAGRHELGLWAVVAASLLASPLAWRGYLVLLYPGVVVLLATARTRLLGMFLVALLLVPHSWPSVWTGRTSMGYLASTLLGPAVLLAVWAAFTGVAARSPEEASGQDPASPGQCVSVSM
ncbi:hypothetical protein Acsp06_54900 [Actinomycetospora sp. NBRC 106375]|uniref:glycosyltransferase 87 family protein n=1 Tax=Actinomycetospora sp. NBRC 106375 TaxID=3032207 RepID=UPI0024A02C76|nr:glycosyltransferase 87 family protein [Actinomycetospora sp. NBRC 106375]GLZ49305.1 hypothetical protein Acsp06_54900 [Actinomycetospora sp. NBRC 106375]